MDAIKLGVAPSRITAARGIVEFGIAVMGHVGLTPQAISVLGGLRPQGRNVTSALKVVETAVALQEAGCFAVVMECVPAPVATAATCPPDSHHRHWSWPFLQRPGLQRYGKSCRLRWINYLRPDLKRHILTARREPENRTSHSSRQ